MAASRSRHWPENGAISGADQASPSRRDVRITLSELLLRVKYTVLPSGVNTGEASLAALEMTPGPNTCGSAASAASAMPQGANNTPIEITYRVMLASRSVGL